MIEIWPLGIQSSPLCAVLQFSQSQPYRLTLTHSITVNIFYHGLNIFQDAATVTFALSIPRGTSFGLYGRRNALPTHTHHNFMEVISGLRHAQHSRAARAAEVSCVEIFFETLQLFFIVRLKFLLSCLHMTHDDPKCELKKEWRVATSLLRDTAGTWFSKGQKNLNIGLTKYIRSGGRTMKELLQFSCELWILR